MAELNWKKITREVDVEVYTTKDGKVFEGENAYWAAGRHETDLENQATLDAILARDPSEVKAAMLAHFRAAEGEDAVPGLWLLLEGISKRLPDGNPKPADTVILTPVELRNLLEVSWRDGNSRPDAFDDEWPRNMCSDVDQTIAELDKCKAVGVPKEAYPDHEVA